MLIGYLISKSSNSYSAKQNMLRMKKLLKTGFKILALIESKFDCHTECLGKEVKDVENFDWREVDLADVVGGTKYPEPKNIKY